MSKIKKVKENHRSEGEGGRMWGRDEGRERGGGEGEADVGKKNDGGEGVMEEVRKRRGRVCK